MLHARSGGGQRQSRQLLQARGMTRASWRLITRYSNVSALRTLIICSISTSAAATLAPAASLHTISCERVLRSLLLCSGQLQLQPSRGLRKLQTMREDWSFYRMHMLHAYNTYIPKSDRRCWIIYFYAPHCCGQFIFNFFFFFFVQVPALFYFPIALSLQVQ